MKIVKVLLIFAVLMFIAASAFAQQTSYCRPYEELKKKALQSFAEKPVFRGLSVNGKIMIEVFLSAKGTFTIVGIDPSKISCVMMAGKNWHGIKPKTF